MANEEIDLFYRKIGEILALPFGADRRRKILDHLRSNPNLGIRVNYSGSLSLEMDADLVYLLKKKKLIRVRVVESRKTSYTFLQIRL